MKIQKNYGKVIKTSRHKESADFLSNILLLKNNTTDKNDQRTVNSRNQWKVVCWLSVFVVCSVVATSTFKKVILSSQSGQTDELVVHNLK